MKPALLLFSLFMVVACNNKFAEYEHLLDPKISEKAEQRMLVYEAVGNPNETVGEALGVLFSTFFKLKREYDLDMMAPVARWPKSADTPKTEWLGI